MTVQKLNVCTEKKMKWISAAEAITRVKLELITEEYCIVENNGHIFIMFKRYSKSSRLCI